MLIIKLLSYQPEAEIAVKALTLWRDGRVVDTAPLRRLSAPIGEIGELNPAVLVFDCDRLPSRAKEVAEAMRLSKSARHIPLLFAGGTEEKIERLKVDVRRGVFASWAEAPEALDRMLASPQPLEQEASPRRVPSYSATPLPQKLGIFGKSEEPREVALLGEPDGFRELLGDLPENLVFTPRIAKKSALALVFVRSASELDKAVALLAAKLPEGASGWIIYPKRQHKPGFNENAVRDGGLALGLVDYKICSVDDDWSGMKFARRKA